MSARRSRSSAATTALASPKTLLDEVRGMILEARQQTARAVNAGLTVLYWQIGARIRREILRDKRAEYGAEIVRTLSAKLAAEFGRGFSEKSLHHMIRFAEAFPDRRIVSALLRELSWSHFLALIYLKDPLQRSFYAEIRRVERWSTRALQARIQSMLFERTALREEGRFTPDLVFRDPYVLDFLGLQDTYSESDLESALLREIEAFLLELGAGFAFLERQKRITLDGDDHYLDLLFYHRRLRRLVAIELKIGSFRPADAGQSFPWQGCATLPR